MSENDDERRKRNAREFAAQAKRYIDATLGSPQDRREHEAHIRQLLEGRSMLEQKIEAQVSKIKSQDQHAKAAPYSARYEDNFIQQIARDWAAYFKPAPMPGGPSIFQEIEHYQRPPELGGGAYGSGPDKTDDDDDDPDYEVPPPAEIVAELDKRVVGQSRAKRALALGAYYHFRRLAEKEQGSIAKSNIALIGPTGTGKTLLLKSLAEVLNVPFVVVDATELTPEGYVGPSVDSFISQLEDTDDWDRGDAIVFIDEADKLAHHGQHGGFKTIEIQKALLKLIEGKSVRRSGRSSEIDTSRMLFVMGGAFSGITSRPDYDPASVSSEQLVRYGLMPEFIGRFPVITSLDALGKDDFVRILKEPAAAVIPEFVATFRGFGVTLTFDDEALVLIAELAHAQGTGARALRGLVEATLGDHMFALPSMASGSTVTIGKADVEKLRPKPTKPADDTFEPVMIAGRQIPKFALARALTISRHLTKNMTIEELEEVLERARKDEDANEFFGDPIN